MDHAQHTGSTAAVVWGTLLATFFGALPGILTCIAALTGTAWSVLMIYESATVQRWLRRKHPAWALVPSEVEERYDIRAQSARDADPVKPTDPDFVALIERPAEHDTNQ